MRLTIRSGPDSGRTVDIADNGLVIGRGEECDLVLDDARVSRRHARLHSLDDGRARVEDLGSANGTYVNDVRLVGPLDLVGDEQLRLGSTVMTTARPAPEAPEAPLAAPAGARLAIVAGFGRGTAVEVTEEDFVVGRAPGCDLVLSDPRVSAQHTHLSALEGGRLRVVDAGSRNGTLVDGARIEEPVEVGAGAELQFGDTTAVVEALSPRTDTVVSAVSPPLDEVVPPAERPAARAHPPRPPEVPAPAAPPPAHAAPSPEVRPPPVPTPPAHAAAPPPAHAAPPPPAPPTDAAPPQEAAPPPPPPAPPTPAGMFLRIDAGPDEGRRVDITSERFLIGRAEGCDLVLRDTQVSRQHAILTARDTGAAIVADLASRNGTFVNGEPVDPTSQLWSGDRLTIGRAELTFQNLAEPIPGARAPAAADSAVSLSPGLSVARPAPRFSTEALARWSSRRPWVTIGLWLLSFAGALVLVAMLFAGALTSEGTVSGNPESKRADTLLEQRLRGPRRITEVVIVSSPQLTVGRPAFRERVESLYDDIIGLGKDSVLGGRHFYQRRDRSLISEDRHSTILPFTMAGDFDHAAEEIPKVTDIVRRADRDRRFEVLINGEASVDADFEAVSERDLRTGEVYGLGVALIVLVFVFSSLVAAAVPLLLAILSIGVGFGLASLVGQVFALSYFVTNMIVGMGLALGIDYSLFVLTRYREERARGRDRSDAIAAAGATSGRAVLFSGIAVVLALVGMLFVPDTVLRSLGVGAILAGAVSVLAALTILPAILGLLGDRVNAGALPRLRRKREGEGKSSVWLRIAELVMRRPVVSLVLSAVILIAATVPVLQLQTGTSGVTTLPDDRVSKQGFEVLERDFSAGTASPAEVVIDGAVATAPVERAIDRLRARVRRDPVFGAAERPEVNKARDLALLTVPIEVDVEGERAIEGVRRLRSEYVPQAFRGVRAEALVTGRTASQLDEEDAVNASRPYVFAFVLGLSFVLLMLAFRSIIVPLKAIVMNLLSVGAAYGVLVLVFQKGYGASLLGFQQVDAVESWVPLFLFSVLFGLSMDYHVFLLSRIRERFNQTGDNREAVAYGVGTTAPLITGAALIMVSVFGGFALGDLVMFQQMGFGLAVALLLDATVVRSVLVPATMTLLGKRNWYLPRWLRWLPEVGVEGQGR